MANEIINSQDWTFQYQEELKERNIRQVKLTLHWKASGVSLTNEYETPTLGVVIQHPAHHWARGLLALANGEPEVQLNLLVQSNATEAILYYGLPPEDESEEEYQEWVGHFQQAVHTESWPYPWVCHWADDGSAWICTAEETASLARRYGDVSAIQSVLRAIEVAHPELEDDTLSDAVHSFLHKVWDWPFVPLVNYPRLKSRACFHK